MKLIDLTSPQIASVSEISHVINKFTESDLPFYRKLGRTDLTVSCLGLGGGGSISSEDTLYAFERGINYFFYSSDLHHYIYSSMSGALRQMCSRRSSVREKVVLATVTYIKSPEMALAALLDQFVELNIDYIDVLFWGWIGENDGSALQNCLQLSPDLRGNNSVYQRTIERMFGASERLKKMGAVRYIGASFHDINLAQQCLHSDLLDVVMVRHNVAHRSAQSQIFNQLEVQDPSRPGIVTFKSTGSHSGALWDVPVDLPEKCWRPTVPDLYRYSLTQNCVDVCLTGLTRREEIDAAISGVQQGKLTPVELDYLNLYGDLHRQKLKIQEISSERLLYQV
ncbi:MAG: aldo/keto reductase [Nostoc sp. NMS1]|uniref:aldo/keto reductase n=1 Tax=unclassified Nostoc TaxID=2593658 RepID=UPI0025F9263A|nr:MULTISPECIES: aldo/keto reductase [unclassified Nostoc]MBN3905580.1 aldo/keto reductase [Nostoc sp. NMS1]MBN3992464.1 aldo/keto reductase [Nostoc sp. NMS2]